MPTRKQLISQIWIYRKRKKDIRGKYGFRNPAYVPMMKNMQRKIDAWCKEIKRIDRRNSKIITLHKKIDRFFNCKLTESHFASTQCRVFFKYGIEELNVEGTKLSRYLKCKNKATGARERLLFTRTFQKNTANKEAYHKFKTYIENK